MDYYFNMLRKCVSKIEADFNYSAEIDHNATKGLFREMIIKNILRPFLPGEYGISSGQAFDKDGTMSEQLDIVLYDALHSYIAPFSDDFIYFPCESVYGIIEVKSKLTTKTLCEAMCNIQSLKALKRESIDTFHIDPMKPLKINNIKWDINATNEYIGIIFAYESDLRINTLLNHIRKNVENGTIQREHIPNIIVLFKERKIIVHFNKCDDGIYEITPLKEFNGLLVENCLDSVFAEFLMLLFFSLRSIELKAMDIETMEKQLHQIIFNNWETDKIIDHIIIK